MSRLARGQAALVARQQKAAASGAETIIYTRKDGGTVDLSGKAWVGRTVFARTSNEGGAAVVHGDRDYLIPVADLAIDGTPFDPERGDQVAHTANGVTATFEVKAPADEPEKRYSDPQRTVWRVHCIEVRTG